MFALVNFTTTLPLALPVSNIPIIDSSSLAASLLHGDGGAAQRMHLRHHRQRMSDRPHRTNRSRSQAAEGEEDDEGDEERDKKRRSLNIPEHGKAKELRLFNTRQNTFVQIEEDGAVRTSPQSNSIHSIFEVLFWCHLAPQLFQPCSNSPSSFSAILMRFKATDRYLCMNQSGKIYTQSPGDTLNDVENCIFQHEFLSNQYDVYYSWKYPNSTQQCERRWRRRRGRTGEEIKRTTCQNRWYLGVDRKGRLCTVKSPRTKIKRNTFFIQRWIHDQAGQRHPEYPNPLAGGTTPDSADGGEGGGMFKVSSTKTRSSSAFDILLHRRNKERTRVTAGEVASKRRDCLNLLKKCDRRRKKPKGEAKEGRSSPAPSTPEVRSDAP